MLLTILIIYLAVINIVGFIIMGVDKSKAKKGAWRIPEKTFFIISAVGGSVGSLLGMFIFRHKTKHWYFVVFIPLILIAQVVIAIVISQNIYM